MQCTVYLYCFIKYIGIYSLNYIHFAGNIYHKACRNVEVIVIITAHVLYTFTHTRTRRIDCTRVVMVFLHVNTWILPALVPILDT